MKEKKINKIKFAKKLRRGGANRYSDKDLTISLQMGADQKRFGFVIRNKKTELILGVKKYIRVGIYEDCLFFCATDHIDEGFAFTSKGKRSNPDNKYAAIDIKSLPELLNYFDLNEEHTNPLNYDLQYDNEENLYFVNLLEEDRNEK